MSDAFLLLAMLAFTMGGGVALAWGHGIGIVAPPKEYRERLKDAAWVPSAIACAGLLVAALNAPTSRAAVLQAAACAVLAIGLFIPKNLWTRSVKLPERTSVARRADPYPPPRVSLRAVVVGFGYAIGIVGWAVALR